MGWHLPSPFPCPDNPSPTRMLWSKRRCHLICYWALIICYYLFIGKSSRLQLLWKQQGFTSLSKTGKEKEMYNNWILIVPLSEACAAESQPLLCLFPNEISPHQPEKWILTFSLMKYELYVYILVGPKVNIEVHRNKTLPTLIGDGVFSHLS